MPEDAGSDMEEGENDNSEKEEEEAEDNNGDEDNEIMVTPKKKSVKVLLRSQWQQARPGLLYIANSLLTLFILSEDEETSRHFS